LIKKNIFKIAVIIFISIAFFISCGEFYLYKAKPLYETKSIFFAGKYLMPYRPSSEEQPIITVDSLKKKLSRLSDIRVEVSFTDQYNLIVALRGEDKAKLIYYSKQVIPEVLAVKKEHPIEKQIYIAKKVSEIKLILAELQQKKMNEKEKYLYKLIDLLFEKGFLPSPEVVEPSIIQGFNPPVLIYPIKWFTRTMSILSGLFFGLGISWLIIAKKRNESV